ncbi:MAG: hypothetical protein CMQ20_11765 [Gammaproteobacteria bacterium]|jgi:hypothetical protein|nr:hypothetical protein [Gammaproteobacteria bacterium]|tara:strand:- start:79 stop:489 length:411 start_codon:yes stop_codon:yes gene_type:complete
MNGELFRVAFRGITTGEYDLANTKERFQKLFRLQPEKVERLFSGKEFIIKDKVSEEVAMHFAIRLAEAGCECYIEALSADAIAFGGAEFKERRRTKRRIQFRRGPRQGAKVPDRRELVGRRKSDQPVPVETRRAAS